MARKQYALIKYKDKSKPLLVEFKPGTSKKKARPYTQKKYLWGSSRSSLGESSWLRRWFK